jgi:hypothetical protein
MTRGEFRHRLDCLGLSAATFGVAVGRDRTVVTMWDEPPKWAALLLDAWETHPQSLLDALVLHPKVQAAVRERLTTPSSWRYHEQVDLGGKIERKSRC